MNPKVSDSTRRVLYTLRYVRSLTLYYDAVIRDTIDKDYNGDSMMV